MAEIIYWSPSDYSPEYKFMVSAEGEFLTLIAVFDIPKGYPNRKKIEMEQHYIDYMAGDGFEKYKKHMAWLAV